jgi:hypothetical protein
MINLSNHVCYHCKHLSRKGRTRHGWLADQYRFYDQQIAELIYTRQFGRIAHFRNERDRVFEAMRQLEEGYTKNEDNYNVRERRKKPSRIPWYPHDEKYW